MLINPDTECPCKSGRISAECCFPAQAPIIMDGPRFTALDINASLTDGIHTSQLPRDWTAEVTVNQPYQQDQSINRLMKSFIELLVPPAGLDESQLLAWLSSRGAPISQLEDSLYATRYHQRQFLFRLGRVYSEQSFAFTPPRGNVAIIINDVPLKVEFEAFLLRVTSTLDAIIKSICTINELKATNFTDFTKSLRKRHLNPNLLDRFDCILRHEDAWIKPLKKLRNDVAHEGESKVFRGVTHRGLLIKDAEIANVPAGGYVIKTWQQLLALVADVIHVQEIK